MRRQSYLEIKNNWNGWKTHEGPSAVCREAVNHANGVSLQKVLILLLPGQASPSSGSLQLKAQAHNIHAHKRACMHTPLACLQQPQCRRAPLRHKLKQWQTAICTG
jgi:hypothetical protein